MMNSDRSHTYKQFSSGLSSASLKDEMWTNSRSNIVFFESEETDESLKKLRNVKWTKHGHLQNMENIPQHNLVTPSSHSVSGGPSSRSKSSTTPQSSTNQNIVAVVEGRGVARGEIGMASIDLKNPVLVLSQFADTQVYLRLAVQLNIIQPIEIIMPNTVLDYGTRTKLMCRIRELFPELNVVTVQRKYFNEGKGLQYIKELSASEYKTVEIEVTSKYYCLAAAAALLKYVEFKQNMSYASNSLKIIYRTSVDTTMISTSTARNLELVTNEMGNVGHTLYGILNHTLTAGGDRLLRANILQPPCNINTVNTRLDCIAELIKNEESFYDLKSVISKFIDTEHLLSLCIQIPKDDNVRNCEQKITNVICMKHALDLVRPLRDCLIPYENALFKTYCQALSDERFQELQEKIGLVIHSDVRFQKGVLNMHMQKCFAVKPNINGLLDIARRAYSESVNDVAEIVKQLETKHELPLQLGYTSIRGFFIQIPCKHFPPNKELPPIFLKVIKSKNMITCTTEDLIKLNDRIKESLNEIYLMSDIIINEVINEIREHIGCLYNLTEAVSHVDFLLSLAHVCTLSDNVRPEFSETLAIKNGRHPVVEKICGTTFTPNNAFMCEDMNFVVLTGANMSGKSTHLKQIAVLQIMAQMGSYVPAEFASFRIADQILSRLGSSNDIEKNYSSFMLQMKEVNYILQHATEKSLIIIDELCRGTNPEEGCALAYSICEELLMTKAFIFCSTHFMELTRLPSVYPNAENYHFNVEFTIKEDGNCTCNFTYKLVPGPCKAQYYGFKLAEISAMPKSIIHEAKQLTAAWAKEENNRNQEQHHFSISDENKEKIKLAIHLLQLSNSSMNEEDLRSHLKELQRMFISPSFSEDNPSTDSTQFS